MGKVLSLKMVKLENIEMAFNLYQVKTLKALRKVKRNIDDLHYIHDQNDQTIVSNKMLWKQEKAPIFFHQFLHVCLSDLGL